MNLSAWTVGQFSDWEHYVQVLNEMNEPREATPGYDPSNLLLRSISKERFNGSVVMDDWYN